MVGAVPLPGDSVNKASQRFRYYTFPSCVHPPQHVKSLLVFPQQRPTATHGFHKLELLSFLDFLELAHILERELIEMLPVLLHLEISLC